MRFPARRAVLSGLGLALLAACGKKPDAGASGWDRIKASGKLRVGLEGTYPPFNFQDKSGQLAGFEVDFAKALAEQLGVKAEFSPAPFAGLLGSLESGRIDVVINQITITPDRQAKYDFSEPYTVSGIQIIALKGKPAPTGPEGLTGKRWAWALARTTSSGFAPMCRLQTSGPMTMIRPSIRTFVQAESTLF